VEYNYASGDRNPHDGRAGTFEQLAPMPLSTVARAADFASRNLHEPYAGIEWQAHTRLKVRGTYRSLWLASKQDALYTLAGAVFASKPGASHAHVGESTELWTIYQPIRRVQLWLGYAHLSSGTYLKEAGHGSSINYPYAMWTYTLL
jgi:hypothetical protein